jgi:hypothetical protein
VIPLYDDIPGRRFPVANVALIVANFSVFLLYELPDLDAAINQASFYPCDVTNACHLGIPWGVSWITSMFNQGVAASRAEMGTLVHFALQDLCPSVPNTTGI